MSWDIIYYKSEIAEVTAHSGPCASNPCYGGSTCEAHDGTFTCFCTADRTGDRCERQLTTEDILIPQFEHGSYVELVPLEKVQHRFSVEIEFKSDGDDGVIMFAQEKYDGTGDFIAILLVNGYLEFRYDLGDGVVILRSRKTINRGQWHKVQAKRWHKDGILKLDGHEHVDGQAPGSQR